MSTIYTWGELSTLTAGTLASADRIFVYDDSAATPKYATMYDIGQIAVQQPISTSSAAATISGANAGITTMGTSTAIFLGAPTRAGIERTFLTTGTSTVAATITASGCSIGLGTSIVTFPSGEDLAITLASVSTAMWLVKSQMAVASTMLS